MGAADITALEPQSAFPPDDDEAKGISQVDWTPEEERKAKWKLDLIIMPLLTLGFFCLQLDRGNIANAITDTFMEDVGITQFQFNVGQQLLSLGIVLFEIPSNMILYKVGPGKWLTLQLFLFGLVSTFQAFQSNYGSYLATRFLLGVTESGYIPGGLWTLSTWYTRKETAKRVMVFFFGNQLGQASAKLIAYGILHMKGVAGYPGWFWLFVIMGAFTMVSGIVLGCFLPDAFHNPHSWFIPRWDIFTPRELHILQTRVMLDDPNKEKKKQHIGLASFKKAFSNWLIWVHIFITLGNNGPFRGFDTYGPTIIRSFGFPSLTSNALSSVGLFLQVPVSFGFSYVSDRFNLRGETTMAAIGMHMCGYILNRIFTEINNRGVRYFGVVWTQTFASFPHPLNITWMSLACRDSEERSLAMAMIIMSANIAAIYGAQLFQADDKPRYRRAFDSNIGILAFALVLAAVRYGYEIYSRKRMGRA
ncbi:putative transporter C1002.16c-like protein 26 [Colletotrichum chlorophyti]|uniref:Putative transporter C1002.16c-like protein 26 n=1 Tax=Colletotrichum chlorophyti TaxID=708187 RepID=A0A1Q8RTG0_9PEZI|nr:putative transporter C1002.16c-like protein 26 [Colletotrichum chlorophyti]